MCLHSLWATQANSDNSCSCCCLHKLQHLHRYSALFLVSSLLCVPLLPQYVNPHTTVNNATHSPLCSIGVVVFLLALKAGEWYLQNARRRATGAAPELTYKMPLGAVPPPPHPPRGTLERVVSNEVSASAVGVASVLTTGGCPLCKLTQRNPTALPSGVVYCHKCIVDHMAAQAREGVATACPVTGQACAVSDVMRLFENTT